MKYSKVVVLLVFIWPAILQASGLEYFRFFEREYISSAIMVISHPDSLFGTGFLTKSPLDPNKLVLTTTKHLVQGARELELQIPILDSNDVIIETCKLMVPLYKDTVIQYYTPESDLDFSLVIINKQLLRSSHDIVWFSSLSYSHYIEMKNLIAGQSVLFAGYPLDLTVNQNQALLRKDTIAGIDTIKDIIYLDADAFGGSSGSPVFVNYDSPVHFEFLEKHKEILVGVIAGYKPFVKKFRNIETGKIEMIQTENSGIAIVVPAEKIRIFADSLLNKQK